MSGVRKLGYGASVIERYVETASPIIASCTLASHAAEWSAVQLYAMPAQPVELTPVVALAAHESAWKYRSIIDEWNLLYGGSTGWLQPPRSLL